MNEAPDVIICPTCKKEAVRIISKSHFRMNKIFSAGGPTINDKDGHESLGMTGEAAEQSEKMEADKRQFIEEERGNVADFAISRSPIVEE